MPIAPAREGQPDARSYLVQIGPVALDSSYSRVVGGTTMHWEGKTLRMLPEDFEMQTRHGVGCDWPVSYQQPMLLQMSLQRVQTWRACARSTEP